MARNNYVRMTKIKFTLGDSDVWHEIELDYLLTNQVFRDEQDLSYIIKREQDRCSFKKAKRVEIYDANGILLAESSDILEWGKLEYKKI